MVGCSWDVSGEVARGLGGDVSPHGFCREVGGWAIGGDGCRGR